MFTLEKLWWHVLFCDKLMVNQGKIASLLNTITLTDINNSHKISSLPCVLKKLSYPLVTHKKKSISQFS